MLVEFKMPAPEDAKVTPCKMSSTLEMERYGGGNGRPRREAKTKNEPNNIEY